MSDIKSFTHVKLICGLIASGPHIFFNTENNLTKKFGRVDFSSPFYEFSITDYYKKQMGPGLERKFLCFRKLIKPEQLSCIKMWTNELEEKIRIGSKAQKRIVNIDPGYMTASALIMATTKDFAHRIPLQKGIYAHLELLFMRKEIKTLNWTYPDFQTGIYDIFFLEARKRYLSQLRHLKII